jgi:hypothetical protein
MLSTCGSVSLRASLELSTQTSMRRVVMNEDLTMLIGPASDGALLEIGALDIDGDDPVVINAMPLRQKFYRFLE